MTSDAFSSDPQAGTTWFAHTAKVDRLPLVAALVNRFNHDLRTPLNTMSGWTHLLRESANDPARTRHMSEVFARNIRDETALLEEFVDDVRSLLDGLVFNPVSVSADVLLTEATERLTPMLDVHDVELDRSGTVEDTLLTVDRSRATRLLYRLLLAAVRRAPAGVTVVHQVGIAPKQFAMEIAAPALKATFDDASLLDLRVASAVTSQLGGTLEIAAPDPGSRFRLRLPKAA